MEQFINIKGVCAITKLKEPTIRKYIACEMIPYVRVGRLIRFRESQIEAWLLNKERNTVCKESAPVTKTKTGGAELFTEL
jgi:excisionase family DNA binding protein